MPNVISPLELHIEVLQGLQKVDGFQQDMFLEEEIDLQLNKQQGRFIEELTNKKFQDKQVYLDYIKNIIVKNYTLPVFTVPSTHTDPLLEPGNENCMVYGILPPNYFHLVSDRSAIYQRTDCNDILDINLPTQVYTETVMRLQIAVPASGSIYVDFEITNTDTAEVVYSGVSFDLRGNLVHNVINNFRDTSNLGIRVYWERYRNEYRQNNFLIVIPGGSTDTYQITYDETPLSGGAGTPVSTNSVSLGDLTFTQINPTPDPDTYQLREITENKLSEGDELYKPRNNTFFTPYITEPHTVLVDQFILAYRDKSFIITNLVLDYIRKPQDISISLNQGCELAGEAPRIIVDKTVEYFKLIIENPAYQGILQDNELRNQTS